jgi:hypothetical protein
MKKFNLVGSLILLTFSLSFCAEDMYLAESLFLKARECEFQGKESLALRFYVEAYKRDPNSVFLRDFILVRYIKADRFKEAYGIYKSLENKSVQVDSEDCDEGSKVAEFYCYAKDTVQAYGLWQRLIYNAVEAHDFNNALALANIFAQNLPQYSVPKRMQAYLIKHCKK